MTQEIPMPKKVYLYSTNRSLDFITDEQHNIFYPQAYAPLGYYHRPHLFELERISLEGNNDEIIYRLSRMRHPSGLSDDGNYWVDDWYTVSTDLYPFGTAVGPQIRPDETQALDFLGRGSRYDSLRIHFAAELCGEQKRKFITQLEQEWGVFRQTQNSPRWAQYQQGIEDAKSGIVTQEDSFKTKDRKSIHHIIPPLLNEQDKEAYIHKAAENWYLDNLMKEKPKFNFIGLYQRMFNKKLN